MDAFYLKRSVSDFPPQMHTENFLKQGVLNSEDVKSTPVCLLLSWDRKKIVSRMRPVP